MAHIESDQPISLPVHRCLQHHLVGWIAQGWTPQKPKVHGNQNLRKGVKDFIHLLRIQPTCIQVSWPGQYSFVLQHQGHRNNHLDFTIQGSNQKLPGCATIASQCCYQYVRVEDKPQKDSAFTISHAIALNRILALSQTGEACRFLQEKLADRRLPLCDLASLREIGPGCATMQVDHRFGHSPCRWRVRRGIRGRRD